MSGSLLHFSFSQRGAPLFLSDLDFGRDLRGGVAGFGLFTGADVTALGTLAVTEAAGFAVSETVGFAF